MSRQTNQEKGQREQPQMLEVFGFQVPTSVYYLHRGHAWAVPESSGQVRVGLDDFSQKILGPADALKLPEAGKSYFQDHIFMAQIRQGHKAPFLAPVDGTIEKINPKVIAKPRLIHDDPYGEGWLYLVQANNLQRNKENLLSGEASAAWINQESHRLLGLMETAIGVTLPDGGAVVDDVFGHYPELGWRALVQDFLLPILARSWRKKGEAEPPMDQETLRREVFRVLQRASADQEFRRTLMDMKTEALAAYKLSTAAQTAILSGDLPWLNEHIGELTQKQLMFVRSCLVPATMA
ncbi:MAG: glycine cleavage system protein H [Desulfobaccales bacterium]